MRCLQIFLWLLGIQVVISRYAQAQSHADTTGIVRALARIITEEAARPGSQHGAFVWKDSASSAWSRLVATELRNRNTDLVATRAIDHDRRSGRDLAAPPLDFFWWAANCACVCINREDCHNYAHDGDYARGGLYKRGRMQFRNKPPRT